MIKQFFKNHSFGITFGVMVLTLPLAATLLITPVIEPIIHSKQSKLLEKFVDQQDTLGAPNYVFRHDDHDPNLDVDFDAIVNNLMAPDIAALTILGEDDVLNRAVIRLKEANPTVLDDAEFVVRLKQKALYDYIMDKPRKNITSRNIATNKEFIDWAENKTLSTLVVASLSKEEMRSYLTDLQVMARDESTAKISKKEHFQKNLDFFISRYDVCSDLFGGDMSGAEYVALKFSPTKCGLEEVNTESSTR